MDSSEIVVKRLLQKIPLRTYQEHAMRYVFASRFVKEKVVLDVGCWIGDGSSTMVDCEAKEVVGIDISKVYIEYAIKHCHKPELHFALCDGRNLPFSNKHFDLAVCFQVIEHIECYERLLSELQRVLKPNGVLILSTPNKRFSSPCTCQPLFSHHLREFQLDELYDLLKSYFAKLTLYGQYVDRKIVIENYFVVAIKSMLVKVLSSNILEKYAENFLTVFRRRGRKKGLSENIGVINRKCEVTPLRRIERVPTAIIVKCQNP